MGRAPCCDEATDLKKGPWTPDEDFKLIQYIEKHGHGKWKTLPKFAGLNRCGKSCRLRWTNYLRPDIKRGKFSPEEEQSILHFHSILGNKWSTIASHLSGRTDNEIKNFWNSHLKKKLIQMGFDPTTHRPRADLLAALHQLNAALMKMEPVAGGWPAMGDHALHIAKLQNFLYLLHPTDAVNSVNSCFDAEHLGAISNSSSSKETLHFPVSLGANIGTSDCCANDGFINFGSGEDEASPFWYEQLLDEPFGV